MTPEEIETQKVEILKDIQRNMLGLTRLSIRKNILESKLSQIESNRKFNINQIIKLMKEYYTLTKSQKPVSKTRESLFAIVYDQYKGEIDSLLDEAFQADEEIMNEALEEIAKQQKI